ncbi:MAG TPA: cation diffusion facilitator family transporter [Planctomycetota bacterium]|nr:cation diffusion facilitator family transporter [Planctomycetota bacterium]
MTRDSREHRGLLAVNLGLAANVVLAALKTAVGILGHSPALLADGVNSTSDVAYYIVVSVFVRLAGRPPDDEHPYGHRQMESIAALVIGAFVMTTGIAIFWDAVNRVYDLLSRPGAEEGALSITLWVALFTVALKTALTLVTRRIGRQTHNPAVMALAYDHRNDIISASAVTIGIFLGRTGLDWVDPLAGAIVALIILRTGVEIIRSAAAELMDSVPSRELAEEIRGHLTGVPGIREVEEIRAHRFGPYLVVNLTIGVDPHISIAEADHIATEIEHTLVDGMDYVRRVDVHCHPVREA